MASGQSRITDAERGLATPSTTGAALEGPPKPAKPTPAEETGTSTRGTDRHSRGTDQRGVDRGPGGQEAVASPFLKSVKSPINDLQKALEEVGKNAGMDLQSVRLVSMERHPNSEAFKVTEFFAWTNSSTEIYVDVQKFQTTAKDLNAKAM